MKHKRLATTLRSMKESKRKSLLLFVEKELLCPQEVISVEKTLRSGIVLMSADK